MQRYDEQQYLDLLDRIMTVGCDGPGRDGSPTRAVFGHQMRFDLSDSFPLLTTKKLHIRSIVYELLWMLQGRTNVKWLNERNVRIWDQWADPEGNLGPIYGKQWRSWAVTDPDGTKREIDQLGVVIEMLRRDPETRRAVVSAWNVADLPKMKLPPCHVLFQFRVLGGRLCCHLYQRSADVVIGLPFNIASYSLLTCMVAEILEIPVGDFIHSIGDAHIYHDQMDAARTQLERTPTAPPKLLLKPRDQISAFQFEDIALVGYKAQPHIHAPVAK